MRPSLIALAVVITALPASADGIAQPNPPERSPTTSPTDRLKEARDAFRQKEYDHATEKLSALLYPTEQLATTQDLVEAHLLLGASFVETGRPGEAKDEFRHVLQLEPNKTLDTLFFSASTVRVFDETKSEVDDERRKIEEERKIEALKKAQEEFFKSARNFETVPYYTNFLPFGLGHFWQHRYAAGAGFLGGELATFGTSAGIWLYILGKYGWNGKVASRDEAQNVQNLEYIEVGTGAVFIGMYALSIFDSLRTWKPHVEIQGDETILPPELRTKPKKQSLLDRIHLVPMAHNGIGIGWEN